MKKIIAVLLAVSMCCIGCGEAKQGKEVTTEVETENSDTDKADVDVVGTDAISVSDEAITDAPTGDAVDTVAAEEEVAPDKNDLEAHVISEHKNAEPQTDVEYFPEQSNLYELEEALNKACASKEFYKDYDYTIEHRVFDFLSADVDDHASNVTHSNMNKIGKQIKDEFFEDSGKDAAKLELNLDGYMENMNNAYVICICEPVDPNVDLSDPAVLEATRNRPCDYFVIVHTLDDPANGVTVLHVPEIGRAELPY